MRRSSPGSSRSPENLNWKQTCPRTRTSCAVHLRPHLAVDANRRLGELRRRGHSFCGRERRHHESGSGRQGQGHEPSAPTSPPPARSRRTLGGRVCRNRSDGRTKPRPPPSGIAIRPPKCSPGARPRTWLNVGCNRDLAGIASARCVRTTAARSATRWSAPSTTGWNGTPMGGSSSTTAAALIQPAGLTSGLATCS